MDSAQRNYTVTEKECLAVVWATEHFRTLLLGTQFELQTDHQALKYLLTSKEAVGRNARWQLKLQQYDMVVTYKPGKKHLNADFFSRLRQDESTFVVNLTSEHFDRLSDEEIINSFQEGTYSATMPIETSTVSWGATSDNVLLDTTKLSNSDADKVTKEEIQQHSLLDENLLKLKIWIAGDDRYSKDSPSLFEWFLNRQRRLASIDGIVYLCDKPLHKKGTFQQETARILAPQTLHDKIIRLAHEHPLNGHRGTMATYRSIANQYAWKGLFTAVANHCKKCASCQSRRAPRGTYPTRARPMSDEPFQTVASDQVP